MTSDHLGIDPDTGQPFSTRRLRECYTTAPASSAGNAATHGGRFTLDVTVLAGSEPVTVPGRPTFVRTDGGYAVYSVPLGRFVFTAGTG